MCRLAIGHIADNRLVDPYPGLVDRNGGDIEHRSRLIPFGGTAGLVRLAGHTSSRAEDETGIDSQFREIGLEQVAKVLDSEIVFGEEHDGVGPDMVGFVLGYVLVADVPIVFPGAIDIDVEARLISCTQREADLLGVGFRICVLCIEIECNDGCPLQAPTSAACCHHQRFGTVVLCPYCGFAWIRILTVIINFVEILQ